MHLQNFLCCMPLIWGVVFMAVTFCTAYLSMGSMAIQMVLSGQYSEWLIEFFDHMPVVYCVAGFAGIFYVLAFINLLLAFGAYTANHRFVGTWLLVNCIEFVLTLVTGLLHYLFLLKIIAVGYTILMVKSFYQTLIRSNSDSDSDDDDHSSDDYSEDEV